MRSPACTAWLTLALAVTPAAAWSQNPSLDQYVPYLPDASGRKPVVVPPPPAPATRGRTGADDAVLRSLAPGPAPVTPSLPTTEAVPRRTTTSVQPSSRERRPEAYGSPARSVVSPGTGGVEGPAPVARRDPGATPVPGFGSALGAQALSDPVLAGTGLAMLVTTVFAGAAARRRRS